MPGFHSHVFCNFFYLYSWWLLQGDSHTLIILEADQEKDLFSSNSAFLFFRWGETISYYELHLWQWLDFFLSLWTMFPRTRPMKKASVEFMLSVLSWSCFYFCSLFTAILVALFFHFYYYNNCNQIQVPFIGN